MSNICRGESRRLPSGGRIDRDRPLRFLFNGRRYVGHPGDTLASALLAEGVSLMARSLKFHRPRGLLSTGLEEPSVLVQAGAGPRVTPNLKATEIELYDGLIAVSSNCWPTPGHDLAALNDLAGGVLAAGFAFRTLKSGRRLPGQKLWRWLLEPALRRAAGWGEAPAEADRDLYDHSHIHCDVLVVGGGAAGLTAALEAARQGARVLLCEAGPVAGGRLADFPRRIDGLSAADWLARQQAALAALPQVTVLTRCPVFACEQVQASRQSQGIVARAVEQRTDHLGPRIGTFAARQRLWTIHARRVLYATGAIEQPMIFSGNDRPGVMLAGAVMALLHRWAVLPGRQAVLFTSDDSAYEVALALLDSGASVRAVVDSRPRLASPLAQAVRERGVEVLSESVVVATRGRHHLSSVLVAPLAAAGKGADGASVLRPWRALPKGGQWIGCDLLAISNGYAPDLALWQQSGGKCRWDETLQAPVPEMAMGELHTEPGRSLAAGALQACIGAAQGCSSLAEGLAGASRLGAGFGRLSLSPPGSGARPGHGTSPEGSLPAGPAVDEPSQALPAPLAVVPAALGSGWGGDKAFVDWQNDVVVADLLLAAREGFSHLQHLKRYTTLGMGTDQGRTSWLAALRILALQQGKTAASLYAGGMPAVRAPVLPVSFGAIAGNQTGELKDPACLSPLHDWHQSAGARFASTGNWQLPRCYPRAGESDRQAIVRECRAARERAVLYDASALGKFDVQGPDAALFLSRLYTSPWHSVGLGRIRYGMMLNDEGFVIDDGTCTRLDQHHYLVTTSAGRQQMVARHMDFWLKTVWPELRVRIAEVGGQWATVALIGPQAREILGRLAPDLYLGRQAFPFMSMQKAAVAGMPARVSRVSFTGELSYEISVPASRAVALWTALCEAGAEAGGEAGMTPAGSGALEILRMEKGFVLVGHETDGAVTPYDLGYHRLVVMTGDDFIGKRSLQREALRCAATGRSQLVGLLTEDPQVVLPEGAQLVGQRPARTASAAGGPPVSGQPAGQPGIGRVTSSCYSPTLGRSIALALVVDGRVRLGQAVHAPLENDRWVTAVVTDPVFLDPQGRRRDG